MHEYTVIVHWNPDDNWLNETDQYLPVRLEAHNPKEAASNACMFTIYMRQGKCYPWAVVEGWPDMHHCDPGSYDSEDYDDVTFTGRPEFYTPNAHNKKGKA